MDLIPVIDLKGGVVVHARRGERAQYRPIETPLCRGSAPQDVLAGLLRLYPFRRVYIADLDGIAGGEGHVALLEALANAFSSVEFWIDNGMAETARAEMWLARARGSLVLGSESQRDTAVLEALSAHPRVVLSLDFRGATFLGPPGILETPALWPGRVIAMTLARVGAGAGPDFERLAALRARAGAREVFAAGGVRGADDLAALAAAGIAGALVASALHSGALDRQALQVLLAPTEA
jgi:phosphoribosylformimino-5-aminoimidazole carboxamide ribotide isomerase